VALLHQGRLLACDTPDRVKGLMRGRILEVRVSRAREAAALLRLRVKAESIGLFGDRIHVVTMDWAQTAREVPAVLQAEGFSLQGMQPIEPSLEDVFVSVVASEEAVPQQESIDALRS
jgi:ABC-2 type transport system ATP-binding protein